jgi:hypothetical protein
MRVIPAYDALVSADDLEQYEAEIEHQLFQEYRDVAPTYRYVVETERRFYLANGWSRPCTRTGGRTRVELELHDAWVWDMYRETRMRFVPSVRVVTFKDVNIEELPKPDIEL